TPHEIIAAAQHSGCQGIAWTYNEPGIWTDFIADFAVVARSVNIYTVLVTNGFLSPECLQLLVPLVDVFRVDLKSLDPQLYQDYAHLKENSPILEAIIHLHRAGAHIELVTVLMPTIIDADHLQRMATWITNELTPDVPWHLTRFVPYARLSNHLPTSHELLSYAEAITHAVGLTRVFVGDWYELEMYG
ncbi:MAG: radical SAM protein, partial [Oscillochloris sp.]|nr:radical SAM protein [Oscillochloris sp.]